AAAKEVKIQAMLTENLPKLRGNHQYIKSSVQHLIRNAVAYTPKGGSIVVMTRLGKTNKGQKAVELVVEDTGIGMSEKVQQ
ncbi:MAG TPA: hypothetical protein PLZ51_21960, partial [Aggregatilineales bacterium]|nr:hypothetical protein [Aggregatilineales bacterium]